MKFSAYNIFSKIKDSDNYYIVNLLTGSADILASSEAEKVTQIKEGKDVDDLEFLNELKEKGYMVDENEEKKLYNQKYLDFLDSRDTDEVQLFYVPGYTCNFACSYCYQDEYTPPASDKRNEKEVIDAFFTYIEREFSQRKKYVTVFGGEPLLNNPKQKETIAYLIDKSNEANLDLCFVTNGYTLSEYVPLLKKGRIREMQVTLDGTESIHNSRRFLKGRQGTFENIIKGIDACLENGLTVNLRMVIDLENIDNLPELAQFAIERGWTKSTLFKTQIGRNYELHHCQSAPDKLFTRISLYAKLFELTQRYPHILEFYKPAYSIAKFLSENGELPEPLFDSCPACKTEWAFDYTGNIYPCTATVGKKSESLGTFYPAISKIEKHITSWENRDVTAIPECRNCHVQLACGGGCGSVAKNKTGNVCSPDCRPVKELLEIGFKAYF